MSALENSRLDIIYVILIWSFVERVFRYIFTCYFCKYFALLYRIPPWPHWRTVHILWTMLTEDNELLITCKGSELGDIFLMIANAVSLKLCKKSQAAVRSAASCQCLQQRTDKPEDCAPYNQQLFKKWKYPSYTMLIDYRDHHSNTFSVTPMTLIASFTWGWFVHCVSSSHIQTPRPQMAMHLF